MIRSPGGQSRSSASTMSLVRPPWETAALPDIWSYLLPYVLIPAVVALMVYVAHSPGRALVANGVYVAGALLIEIMFIHQYLSYRELIAHTSKSVRLESLAASDPITGLPNHRSVVTNLDQELHRSRRSDIACSILFLDLDRFKKLNDTFGHPAGDAALREFASVARVALRGSDTLGRWGGEEFVALLPEADADEACAVAERVREAVAAHRFRSIGGAHVTCSIGVASFPRHASQRDNLVDLGDQAMYASKRDGRNRVSLAPAVPSSTD